MTPGSSFCSVNAGNIILTKSSKAPQMMYFIEQNRRFLGYLEKLHAVEHDTEALQALWNEICGSGGSGPKALAFAVFSATFVEMDAYRETRMTWEVRKIFVDQAVLIRQNIRKVTSLLELPSSETDPPSFWKLQQAYCLIREFYPKS